MAKVLREPFARRDSERDAALPTPHRLPLASRAKAKSYASSRPRTIKVPVVDDHNLSRQAIADKLFLNINHRDAHVSQKLDLRGPADFTRYAIKIGLVQS